MTNLITKVQGMDRQKLESLFTSSAFLITSGLLFVNLFVLSNALGDSGRALSVHIYTMAMEVNGGEPAAYRSAAVLVVLLLGINLAAAAVGRKYARRMA